MSKKEVIVIGHRNPDTDAICSAIGYAEFKRRTGLKQAVAARCGPVNDRTDFVLKAFGVRAPKFVSDVSPKARDVMQRGVVSVSPNLSAFETFNLMDRSNVRVLPVLDDDQKCLGLVSIFKMNKFLVPKQSIDDNSRRILSSVDNLAKTLRGTVVCGENLEGEQELILMIAAMGLNSFVGRFNKYPHDRTVIIVGDRVDIQRLAIKEKVRALIVTGGLMVEEEIIAEAKSKGVTLIQTPFDSATTASLARTAVSVRHMIHSDYLTFHQDEPLSSVQRLASGSNLRAFPILDDKDRVVGIISKSDFVKSISRKLILVDHNEISQAVRGAQEAEIIEIVDHHRIGTLSTNQPIVFRNEPVGSTSTIVAESYFLHGVKLPSKIAGLLLAGLVSDTLNLTSPTTTERDAIVLKRLEELAGVNAAEFTEKLFASGSLLTTKTAQEAITTDCKEYKEDDIKFSVAQIEEIGFDQFRRRKTELTDALATFQKANSYFFSTVLITDITHQNSLLLVSGPQHLLDAIAYPEIEPGVFDLHGVVSRKKQLLPFLMDCLSQALCCDENEPASLA